MGVHAFENDTLSVKLNGAEIATINASDFASGSIEPITKTVSFPIDSHTPATITIEGSSIKNSIEATGSYNFTVKLADPQNVDGNSVTLTQDTLVGNTTTIQWATLTLQNPTAPGPTTDIIYNSASSQEI